MTKKGDMIKLLSDMGRTLLVAAALLVIGLATIVGYFAARVWEEQMYGVDFPIRGGVITSREVAYSVVSCGIGIILAGAIFGALATLYDIRDSLRLLVRMQVDQQSPTVRASARREPRLD